ncbi:uncharacterized protein LOC114518913 [Dendronephthya gigantea]|uniref:uncharacterized protein LOC114518913 n=1 Tax=Dendronephthya gigantea TaxID=151771 RepID=UPI00106D4C79|nr:uncharacterized protein LOC114518913 [Dendronephthya gigantea]
MKRSSVKRTYYTAVYDSCWDTESTLRLLLNSLSNKTDSYLNIMSNVKSLLFLLPFCLFAISYGGPVNHLDVFIARRELKRFFNEFDIGDFYIIRKGVIDNFVQNKATGFLPAIAPETQSLELKFQSRYKLYYKLYMSSSDRSIMKIPSSTIRPNGHVPRKARPFKIRFPCTRRKTGTAMLKIKMEFMLPAMKRSPITEFVLNLKRSCEKAKEVVTRKPATAKTNYICSKKCDRNNVLRRFCLSDFAIRARVETSSTSRGGRPLHKVRVTKYYKRSRVPIGKKIDIEIFGTDITCKCELLQIGKTYLILGKENSFSSSFFLDDYTYAIEWGEGGKKMAKLHKKRSTCPKRFGQQWYPIGKV